MLTRRQTLPVLAASLGAGLLGRGARAAEAVNGPNNSTDRSNLALKEAYVDYIAPIGKGLTFTFGKFVTPAGAEVIETNGNWDYSRSILFYYAIPYFHFGANAKYTFNTQWAITGYLVNGWNNSQEVNTGKTYVGKTEDEARKIARMDAPNGFFLLLGIGFDASIRMYTPRG